MPEFQLDWQTLESPKPLLTHYYNCPAGTLAIQMQGKLLNNFYWLLAPQPLGAIGNSNVTMALAQQMQQYWLTGQITTRFDLLKQGTEFQRKVWHALCQIPAGQTKTYGELARELNTSPRALANACRKNPFPLLIPCHRILAKTGIGGYAGATTGKLVDIKVALLQHEKMLVHEL